MTLQEKREKAFKDACFDALWKINEFQRNINDETFNAAEDACYAARGAAIALSNGDVLSSKEMDFAGAIKDIFDAIVVDYVENNQYIEWT